MPSPSTLSSPFAEKAKPTSPNFNNLPGARIPKSVQNAKPTRVLEITKEQANDAFNSCLQLIRKHDVDSYLSILMMPKKAQPEFVAINALNVELAQVRDKVDTRRGDTSAMYRLQFWKDAISSIYGISTLPVPRQPVAIALCVFAKNANSNLFLKLVESRQSTIGDRQFSSINALSEYGRSTTGSLLSLQIDALARVSKTIIFPPVYDVANDLGASYAIVNLLRSALPLLARGTVIIPSDVMSLNGATPDSIYNKKKLEETRGVVRDLVKESRVLLDNARSQVEIVPRDIRPAISTTASVIDHIISVIEKNNYDIYCPHLQRRNPLLLWSILWRKISGKF